MIKSEVRRMSKMAAEGKKLQKGKGGIRMVPVNDLFSSPFTLPEPAWVPDAQVRIIVLLYHEDIKVLTLGYCS